MRINYKSCQESLAYFSHLTAFVLSREGIAEKAYCVNNCLRFGIGRNRWDQPIFYYLVQGRAQKFEKGGGAQFPVYTFPLKISKINGQRVLRYPVSLTADIFQRGGRPPLDTPL